MSVHLDSHADTCTVMCRHVHKQFLLDMKHAHINMRTDTWLGMCADTWSDTFADTWHGSCFSQSITATLTCVHTWVQICVWTCVQNVCADTCAKMPTCVWTYGRVQMNMPDGHARWTCQVDMPGGHPMGNGNDDEHYYQTHAVFVR